MQNTFLMETPFEFINHNNNLSDVTIYVNEVPKNTRMHNFIQPN